jgi:hypothetical protein
MQTRNGGSSGAFWSAAAVVGLLTVGFAAATAHVTLRVADGSVDLSLAALVVKPVPAACASAACTVALGRVAWLGRQRRRRSRTSTPTAERRLAAWRMVAFAIAYAVYAIGDVFMDISHYVGMPTFAAGNILLFAAVFTCAFWKESLAAYGATAAVCTVVLYVWIVDAASLEGTAEVVYMLLMIALAERAAVFARRWGPPGALVAFGAALVAASDLVAVVKVERHFPASPAAYSIVEMPTYYASVLSGASGVCIAALSGRG